MGRLGHVGNFGGVFHRNHAFRDLGACPIKIMILAVGC